MRDTVIHSDGTVHPVRHVRHRELDVAFLEQRIVEHAPEVLRRAGIAVCSQVQDRDEAVLVLQMLGLLEGPHDG